LPALRKDAKAKTARFEKVNAHLIAETKRLEDEAGIAWGEMDRALKAQYAAKASADKLLLLYDEGLLPTDRVPEEVRRLIARREAEGRWRQACSVINDARSERDHWKAKVRDIERRMAEAWEPRDTAALKAPLKEVQRKLADAEDRLKKAEAAEDAAKRAIPEF